MRYKLLAALVFITRTAQAQQVNPVPDYVFANRMSVGRNAVTDTLAYFSIGPRYGAIRGFMPPMVVDTALVTGGTKRNGLTIFSIQKNKYVYWDSVGSKWAEMAGTGGSAITGTGVAGYMPEFTTATNLDSTTLYHSAGRFAIGSTTVSNGRFSVFGGQAYFDTSLKVGSQAFLADEGKNEVYVNTTSDAGAYPFQLNGGMYTNGKIIRGAVSDTTRFISAAGGAFEMSVLLEQSNDGVDGGDIFFFKSRGSTSSKTNPNVSDRVGTITFAPYVDGTFSQSATMFGEVSNVNTTIDSAHVDIVFQQAYTGVPIQDNMRLYADGGDLYVRGDVRIGTTSGTTSSGFTYLTVNGSSYGAIELRNAGSSRASFYHDGSNLLLNASTGGTVFGTAGIERMRITSAGEILMNTSSDAGAYVLQVAGAIYNTTTLTTGAPTSGTAKPWRLGEAATVSPTSPNRTIRVEIDGTVYYLHAKTTND